MKRKIGEIFEYNGEWYQAIEQSGKFCKDCYFYSEDGCFVQTGIGWCRHYSRNDNKSIIYKKLEKLGEPFERNGYLYQEYKTHIYPLLMSGGAKIPTDNGFAAIIKQNKEDMEEVNNPNLSNTEKIGKNLKPFDLEAAKAGKPVCTRDGRPVRIICFDRDGDRPIIALITDIYQEKVETYYNNGQVIRTPGCKDDLMMLPEKKRDG